MSEILSKQEKAEMRKRAKQKADVTYKIIASSPEKVENCISLLRRIYGSENIIVSPIMKSVGDQTFHCFLNVLNVSSEVER